LRDAARHLAQRKGVDHPAASEAREPGQRFPAEDAEQEMLGLGGAGAELRHQVGGDPVNASSAAPITNGLERGRSASQPSASASKVPLAN
jgi:hypothetical protein